MFWIPPRAQEDNSAKLLAAATAGRVDEVRALVKSGVHVDCRDKYGMTSLNLAAENSHYEVVVILLKHRAKVVANGKRTHDSNTQQLGVCPSR